MVRQPVRRGPARPASVYTPPALAAAARKPTTWENRPAGCGAGLPPRAAGRRPGTGRGLCGQSPKACWRHGTRDATEMLSVCFAIIDVNRTGRGPWGPSPAGPRPTPPRRAVAGWVQRHRARAALVFGQRAGAGDARHGRGVRRRGEGAEHRLRRRLRRLGQEENLVLVMTITIIMLLRRRQARGDCRLRRQEENLVLP